MHKDITRLEQQIIHKRKQTELVGKKESEFTEKLLEK